MELQQRLMRDLEMFEQLVEHSAENDDWGAHHDWLIVCGYIKTVLADEGVSVPAVAFDDEAHQATLFPMRPSVESQLALRTVDPAIEQLSEIDEGS